VFGVLIIGMLWSAVATKYVMEIGADLQVHLGAGLLLTRLLLGLHLTWRLARAARPRLTKIKTAVRPRI